MDSSDSTKPWLRMGRCRLSITQRVVPLARCSCLSDGRTQASEYHTPDNGP